LLKWIDLYIMYLTLTLTFILLLMKKAWKSPSLNMPKLLCPSLDYFNIWT
jgi:hypothetical protein